VSRRKPTESALLVPAPGAESLVEGWRSLYDPSAAWGIPAHVKLLHPFIPPEQIDDALLVSLGELFAHVDAFDVTYGGVAHFPGVLYLAPTPDAPFRALTSRLVESFPGYPPYGGAYEDVIPHLTVVDVRARLDLALMKRAHDELSRSVPVPCRAAEAWLMVGDRRRWRPHTKFELRRCGDGAP